MNIEEVERLAVALPDCLMRGWEGNRKLDSTLAELRQRSELAEKKLILVKRIGLGTQAFLAVIVSVVAVYFGFIHQGRIGMWMGMLIPLACFFILGTILDNLLCKKRSAFWHDKSAYYSELGRLEESLRKLEAGGNGIPLNPDELNPSGISRRTHSIATQIIRDRRRFRELCADQNSFVDDIVQTGTRLQANQSALRQIKSGLEDFNHPFDENECFASAKQRLYFDSN